VGRRLAVTVSGGSTRSHCTRRESSFGAGDAGVWAAPRRGARLSSRRAPGRRATKRRDGAAIREQPSPQSRGSGGRSRVGPRGDRGIVRDACPVEPPGGEHATSLRSRRLLAVRGPATAAGVPVTHAGRSPGSSDGARRHERPTEPERALGTAPSQSGPPPSAGNATGTVDPCVCMRRPRPTHSCGYSPRLPNAECGVLECGALGVVNLHPKFHNPRSVHWRSLFILAGRAGTRTRGVCEGSEYGMSPRR
jgi:hypothetical protein